MTRERTTHATPSRAAKRQETRSDVTGLPVAIEEALRRVVDYLWDAETRDYQGEETHIWPHLNRLRIWLGM